MNFYSYIDYDTFIYELSDFSTVRSQHRCTKSVDGPESVLRLPVKLKLKNKKGPQPAKKFILYAHIAVFAFNSIFVIIKRPFFEFVYDMGRVSLPTCTSMIYTLNCVDSFDEVEKKTTNNPHRVSEKLRAYGAYCNSSINSCKLKSSINTSLARLY